MSIHFSVTGASLRPFRNMLNAACKLGDSVFLIAHPHKLEITTVHPSCTSHLVMTIHSTLLNDYSVRMEEQDETMNNLTDDSNGVFVCLSSKTLQTTVLRQNVSFMQAIHIHYGNSAEADTTRSDYDSAREVSSNRNDTVSDSCLRPGEAHSSVRRRRESDVIAEAQRTFNNNDNSNSSDAWPVLAGEHHTFLSHTGCHTRDVLGLDCVLGNGVIKSYTLALENRVPLAVTSAEDRLAFEITGEARLIGGLLASLPLRAQQCVLYALPTSLELRCVNSRVTRSRHADVQDNDDDDVSRRNSVHEDGRSSAVRRSSTYRPGGGGGDVMSLSASIAASGPNTTGMRSSGTAIISAQRQNFYFFGPMQHRRDTLAEAAATETVLRAASHENRSATTTMNKTMNYNETMHYCASASEGNSDGHALVGHAEDEEHDAVGVSARNQKPAALPGKVIDARPLKNAALLAGQLNTLVSIYLGGDGVPVMVRSSIMTARRGVVAAAAAAAAVEERGDAGGLAGWSAEELAAPLSFTLHLAALDVAYPGNDSNSNNSSSSNTIHGGNSGKISDEAVRSRCSSSSSSSNAHGRSSAASTAVSLTHVTRASSAATIAPSVSSFASSSLPTSAPVTSMHTITPVIQDAHESDVDANRRHTQNNGTSTYLHRDHTDRDVNNTQARSTGTSCVRNTADACTAAPGNPYSSSDVYNRALAGLSSEQAIRDSAVRETTTRTRRATESGSGIAVPPAAQWATPTNTITRASSIGQQAEDGMPSDEDGVRGSRGFSPSAAATLVMSATPHEPTHTPRTRNSQDDGVVSTPPLLALHAAVHQRHEPNDVMDRGVGSAYVDRAALTQGALCGDKESVSSLSSLARSVENAGKNRDGDGSSSSSSVRARERRPCAELYPLNYEAFASLADDMRDVSSGDDDDAELQQFLESCSTYIVDGTLWSNAQTQNYPSANERDVDEADEWKGD